jgi:hypothetical protein
VTLGRLLLAWIVVAIWFLIATFGITTLAALLARPAGQDGFLANMPLTVIKWRLAEAALLTLFASLWFDSLGSGAWWVLFLLVGALATIPEWLRARLDRVPTRAWLVGAGLDLARYVAAGALLAWRLA